MHETSYAKMAAFVKGYLANYHETPIHILELGSRCVLGQNAYRPLFAHPAWTYTGADIEAGENVELVLKDSHQWNEVDSDTIDVVISGQMLEHSDAPWIFIMEARRVLKPGGLVCLIVPSSGNEHRFPIDCWRFYRDAMHVFGRQSDLTVVEAFTDYGLGDWQDTFGVFQKPLGGEVRPAPFSRQSSLDVAFHTYRDALRNRPRNLGYYQHLLRLQEERGQALEAELTCRGALDAFPGNVPFRAKLAALLTNRGEYPAAAEHCLSLLGQGAISQDNARITGRMYEMLPATAAELFTFALPEQAEKLRRLAQLVYNAECYSFATLCWGKLSSMEPDSLDTQAMHCLSLLGAGRCQEALNGFAIMRQSQIERGEVNRTTVLQRLISHLGAQRYLEIGVFMGTNFFQIEAAEKHGVDPALLIPRGQENPPGVHLHPQTSDEFFALPPQSLCENGVDVALVDGDHTANQILRDLENLLDLLGENGVIVVHDCLPANEAEAAPSYEEAKMHKSFNLNWTGDGYKAIAHLRATRNDLFVAVLDCDHGVGLVRRGEPESRLEMTPAEIDALDYHALRLQAGKILNLKRPEWFDKFLIRLGQL